MDERHGRLLFLERSWPTEYYFGADIERIVEPEEILTMELGTYIDKCLTTYGHLFEGPSSNKIYTLLDFKDHPELDKSAFLDQTGIQLY